MKKFIIIILLATLGTAIAMAQGRSLNVAQFFTDESASLPSVTMVMTTGNQLQWSGCNKYASVSVTGDNALADKLAAAVKKDGVKAESKETSYKEGKLYFGFYNLGWRKDERRYLFFLDRRPTGVDKTTLVYISGDLSPEEVKKFINKKK